ncbi:MAG: threonine synthase [Acidobacteria bacterium]|nr:threonine synthase [Acidobacteriota bacterium]
MTRFISTRGQAPAVGFREALLAGLAPDGGLYVPQAIPRLPDATWRDLRGHSLADIGTTLIAPLIGDELPRATLHALLADALDFPIPLVPLGDRISMVELFHGPTFAFKDVGARVLARMMSAVHDADAPPLTVLVATSGDTGGAVAQAFHGVPRTRVVVLYPHGQVSAVQEAQFTTLGGNVSAIAVQGTFDDCQRLAKEAFARADLRADANLTSANSISLGRLLPQMIYYAHAALTAGEGPPLAVSVPSGNFGNLAAGLMAARMGAQIAGFHAATNINDTVPRYLASGRFEPRPSVQTLANAMDVGHPSNLERIRWMFADQVQAVRDAITSSVHTDDDVRRAMRRLHDEHGYVADPHSAIAWLGALRRLEQHPDERVLALATAHPAKFGDVVSDAIGRDVPIPLPLAAAMTRTRQVTHIEARPEALVPLVYA